jgi:hypothetical protein
MPGLTHCRLQRGASPHCERYLCFLDGSQRKISIYYLNQPLAGFTTVRADR